MSRSICAGVIARAGFASWMWVLILGVACGPRGGVNGGAVVAPSDGSAGELRGEGRQEGESIGELELRLRRLVAEQTGMVDPANAEAGSCEALCSLSTSICGVKEKICNIADRHPGDASYVQLCREAKLECRESRDACIRCVELHVAGPATVPVSDDP